MLYPSIISHFIKKINIKHSLDHFASILRHRHPPLEHFSHLSCILALHHLRPQLTCTREAMHINLKIMFQGIKSQTPSYLGITTIP